MAESEKKLLMDILRDAAEKALKELRKDIVGAEKDQVSEKDFNVFAVIVSETLDEVEGDFTGNASRDSCRKHGSCAFQAKIDAPDFVLSGRLVAAANEAARRENKGFSEWLTELIVKELFY